MRRTKRTYGAVGSAFSSYQATTIGASIEKILTEQRLPGQEL
jgi:hypothetical protein